MARVLSWWHSYSKNCVRKRVVYWHEFIVSERKNGPNDLRRIHNRPYKDLNPLKPELNPICYLLALLAHHFFHVSRIRVKSLTLRLLMSYIYIYIYGAHILDVSRSHTTTRHSR